MVGAPDAGSKLVAFVAMPFTEKSGVYPVGFFDEVIRHLITPAAVAAGFRVETAKKRGSDVIHATIIRDLMAADLVIADLTEHNPNVLFELGWRMAIDKPIALIRALGTKPVFDVDHVLRVFDYSPNLWKSTVEKDIGPLSDHLNGAWANRDSKASYAKLLMDREG